MSIDSEMTIRVRIDVPSYSGPIGGAIPSKSCVGESAIPMYVSKSPGADGAVAVKFPGVAASTQYPVPGVRPPTSPVTTASHCAVVATNSPEACTSPEAVDAIDVCATRPMARAVLAALACARLTLFATAV
jgi:hypothetical protein